MSGEYPPLLRDSSQPSYTAMEGTSQEKLGTSQKTGFTGRLAFAIFTSTLGMFNFGYNTGVINAPQAVIELFYNETLVNRGEDASPSTVDLLWSITVAIFAVGGMLGGLGGGWWAEKFGRKTGMLYNTAIGILAGLLMGISKVATSYEVFIVGRFLVGVNCGLYTGLTPMYNSEVSPDSIRGAIGTINQLGVTIALLVSQVLGLSFVLGTETLWPLLMGLAAVIPFIQLLTLPFCPESPRYSLINKGEEGEALKALMLLRGASNEEEVSEEMDMMRKEAEVPAGEEKMSLLQVLRTSWLLKPLLVAVLMHLSQQLSGISFIFYYSTTLFQNVGLTESEAQYATIGVGGIMVVMTLITIPLMDIAGRRTLHLVGLAGIFISSIVFTVAYSLQDSGSSLKYVAIASCLIFVVFFALGPGSIPWMIVAELFPQGPRAVAVSIAVVVNWLCNFLVGVTFTSLQKALDTLVFIPFTIIVFILFWALFFLLPETKNKTIDEISSLFHRPESSSYDKESEHYPPADAAQPGHYTRLDS